MFDKHYNQLKDRYKELLSEEELKQIFENCNPKNKNQKSFIQNQKRFYTILWISSVAILAITLTVILIINNFQVLVVIKNFLSQIICCTKSI